MEEEEFPDVNICPLCMKKGKQSSMICIRANDREEVYICQAGHFLQIGNFLIQANNT